MTDSIWLVFDAASLTPDANPLKNMVTTMPDSLTCSQKMTATPLCVSLPHTSDAWLAPGGNVWTLVAPIIRNPVRSAADVGLPPYFLAAADSPERTTISPLFWPP